MSSDDVTITPALIRRAMQALAEYHEAPPLGSARNPILLPPALYKAAKKRGIDVTGYAPRQLLPRIKKPRKLHR
jgi:hypothetical protein